MDVVIVKVKSLDEALRMVEDQFLDDHVKLFNDHIWLELSFSLKILKSVFRN